MLWYKTVAVGQRGFPDVVAVGPTGAVAFIELKSPSGKGRVGACQERVHRDLTEHGARVYVCSSKESVTEALNAIA